MGNYYNERPDNLKNSIVIIFFILLIIMTFVGVFYTVFKDTAFVKEKVFIIKKIANVNVKPENVTTEKVINITDYNYTLTIRPIIEYNIPFTMTEGGNYLYSGNLNPFILEKYFLAKYNRTYTIEGQSDEYYYLRVDCPKIFSDTDCGYKPKKKAFISVILTEHQILINPIDGIIQKPIICLAWGQNTLNINLPELQQIPIPTRLLKFVDVCYAVNNDVEISSIYPMEINKLATNKDKIEIKIIDYEIGNVTSKEYTYDEDTGLPDYEKTIIV